MNWQGIIDEALLTTWSKITDVWWYPVFSKFLDDVHKLYYDEIKKINENFFYDRQYIDLVAYQNKYDFATPTSLVWWVDKILKVWVKYQLEAYPAWSASTSYVQRDRVIYNWEVYMAKTSISPNVVFQSASFAQLYEGYVDSVETTFYDMDTDTRNTVSPQNTYSNQSPLNVKHIFANNSLYVYPRSEQNITKGIKLDYIKSPIDIDYQTTEANILIPRIYHKYMAITLREYVYLYQQKEQQAMNAKVRWDQALQDCISAIRGREASTFVQTTPDLYDLS